MNRRQFVCSAAATAIGMRPVAQAAWSNQVANRRGCTLSIGTYSLKGLSVEESIKLVAGIGYDGIEIAVQPGFDGEPERMPADRRRKVRDLLGQSGLELTAIMEQLYPAEDDRRHAEHLERLGRVMDVAHDLGGAVPPLVQTVLGGGEWEKRKTLFRDRLGDWVEIARRAGIVLAIKPHRGGGMSRPEEAIWLIRQFGDTPWLRMVYDYSHYAFRGMPLEETVKTALPYTAHVVVKDAVEQGQRVAFALPGEAGTIDYVSILRLFYQGGYRGDVCCEVSSMISNKPGYDPRTTAHTCYRNMAPLFEKAGVPRGRAANRGKSRRGTAATGKKGFGGGRGG
jgi:inosose dehydratase